MGAETESKKRGTSHYRLHLFSPRSLGSWNLFPVCIHIRSRTETLPSATNLLSPVLFPTCLATSSQALPPPTYAGATGLGALLSESVSVTTLSFSENDEGRSVTRGVNPRPHLSVYGSHPSFAVVFPALFVESCGVLFLHGLGAVQGLRLHGLVVIYTIVAESATTHTPCCTRYQHLIYGLGYHYSDVYVL